MLRGDLAEYWAVHSFTLLTSYSVPLSLLIFLTCSKVETGGIQKIFLCVILFLPSSHSHPLQDNVRYWAPRHACGSPPPNLVLSFCPGRWDPLSFSGIISHVHAPGYGGLACLGYWQHFPRALCSSTCTNTFRPLAGPSLMTVLAYCLYVMPVSNFSC